MTAPPERSLRSLRRASVLSLFTLACASGQVGPVDVLAAYTQNLREGRYPEAWMMLSSEARQALPYPSFEQAARDRPEEIREAIRALGSPDPRAPILARLELDSGDAVTLVQEGGQWRLDPSTLEFYGQRSPRQCLRTFVRALERRRWDVLVRLAPRAVIDAMSEVTELSEAPVVSSGSAPSGLRGRLSPAERLRVEWTRQGSAERVQATLEGLRQALLRDRPIEVVGDRASMAYGPGGQLIAQLVREGGLWKIEHTE